MNVAHNLCIVLPGGNKMEFGYTEEEERFREKLADFLDRELTEEIRREAIAQDTAIEGDWVSD